MPGARPPKPCRSIGLAAAGAATTAAPPEIGSMFAGALMEARSSASTTIAVANGFVSVTPLQVDLTRHSALEGVREWLSGPAP